MGLIRPCKDSMKGLTCGSRFCENCGFNPTVAQARKAYLREHPPKKFGWWVDPDDWEALQADPLTMATAALTKERNANSKLTEQLADTELKLKCSKNKCNDLQSQLSLLQAELIVAKSEANRLAGELHEERRKSK